MNRLTNTSRTTTMLVAWARITGRALLAQVMREICEKERKLSQLTGEPENKICPVCGKPQVE